MLELRKLNDINNNNQSESDYTGESEQTGYEDTTGEIPTLDLEEDGGYVAIDIGLIGPDYDGNEHKVTICAKDNSTPYDYELTNRLIALAEENGIDHAMQEFNNFQPKK